MVIVSDLQSTAYGDCPVSTRAVPLSTPKIRYPPKFLNNLSPMGNSGSSQAKISPTELSESKRKSIISLADNRNYEYKNGVSEHTIPSPGRRSSTPRQSIIVPSTSIMDSKKPLNRSTTANHLNSLVAVWQAKVNLTGSADVGKSLVVFPNNIWFHIFRFCSLRQLTTLMRCNKALFLIGYHAYHSVAKRLRATCVSANAISPELRIRCTCSHLSELF